MCLCVMRSFWLKVAGMCHIPERRWKGVHLLTELGRFRGRALARREARGTRFGHGSGGEPGDAETGERNVPRARLVAESRMLLRGGRLVRRVVRPS